MSRGKLAQLTFEADQRRIAALTAFLDEMERAATQSWLQDEDIDPAAVKERIVLTRATLAAISKEHGEAVDEAEGDDR